MKAYVTFADDQVFTMRGIVFDKNCIAELRLDVEHDFKPVDIENEIHYLFGSCYDAYHLHTPPTGKYYSRGIIAAN